MSWRPTGTQAMLRPRSVLLNGEWEEYQDAFRAEERKAPYSHRGCLESLPWPAAAWDLDQVHPSETYTTEDRDRNDG